MTLTYISCSSDFYTFYVNVPLSLGCMIRKVSAEDIAIRGNGTGLESMCPTRHFVYIFFNPVFQVSTAKNEINLFNNHVLIVAPVTFAPAGAMTPSADFLCIKPCKKIAYFLLLCKVPDKKKRMTFRKISKESNNFLTHKMAKLHLKMLSVYVVCCIFSQIFQTYFLHIL